MFWLWVLVLVLFALGLVGIFVPGVPGIGLIFGGILLYALWTDFAAISVGTVVGLGVVALLAWLADWVGAALGARAGGGGLLSLVGMVLGGLLGLLSGGPLGLVIGVFLGAFVGALQEGKRPEQAGRAALFSLVGLVGATVVQVVLGVSMIVAFVVAVFV